ncbi:hypothetical protein V6N13_006202 [Hibiscus sabdariffa]
MAEYKEKNDVAIQNLAASMRNLEMQIGQLANAFSSKPQGALSSKLNIPGNTAMNSRSQRRQLKKRKLKAIMPTSNQCQSTRQCNETYECQVDDKLESFLKMDISTAVLEKQR